MRLSNPWVEVAHDENRYLNFTLFDKLSELPVQFRGRRVRKKDSIVKLGLLVLRFIQSIHGSADCSSVEIVVRYFDFSSGMEVVAHRFFKKLGHLDQDEG